MASPQKENGYTPIANDIMDALIAYRIPGEQMKCLLFILRKTYGFNKKRDAISLSQFVDATGLKKPNVVRSLSALLSKMIIGVIKSDNGMGHIYEFIKDYDKWKPLSKKITVIKSDNASLSKVIPTKDNTTKDNIYSRAIDYLNRKTGKNFSSKTKTTRSHINARLAEGFRPEDFKKVIDGRCEKWLDDSEMVEYLRPQTLFGTKFESYLNGEVGKLDTEETCPNCNGSLKEMRNGICKKCHDEVMK